MWSDTGQNEGKDENMFLSFLSLKSQQELPGYRSLGKVNANQLVGVVSVSLMHVFK